MSDFFLPWLLLIFVGGAGGLWIGRWYRGRTRQARFAKGRAAEPRAAVLAERCGYRVLATQVPGTVNIQVDGSMHAATVRADLLLARGGRRFVGEVKTGRHAPDPTGQHTRRQLLEYTTAFQVDGLLLFDMEAERIREIRFPKVRTARPRAIWAMLFLAVGSLIEALWGPLAELNRLWTGGS